MPWVRWSGGGGRAAVDAALRRRRALAAGALALAVVLGGWAATVLTPAARARRLEGRAEIHLRLGDVAAATSAFADALALQPARADLVARLAEARLAQGDLEGAAAVTSPALAADPGQPLVAAMAAQVELLAGRPEAAWAALAPALERVRGLPDATTRARALLIAGRTALARPRGAGRGDAAALLDEAERAGAAPEVPGPARAARADALVLLAGLALEGGRTDEGLAALAAAEQAAPERDDVATVHARALEAAGRPDAAVERLARRVWWPAAEAGQPPRLRDPAAAPALAELLVRLGRLADADALAAALRGGSPDAAAYVEGLAALARDDPAGAAAAFARLAGAAPGAAWPLLLQAHAALRAGARDEARALLEEALRREPERVEAELGLLQLEEARGDRAAVRARAERLLDRPRARAAAVRALFAIYAQDKDARGAAERLEALAARFPDDVAVRVDLALFRVLAGDPAGADRGAAELEAAAAAPDLRAAFEALARAQEAGTDALEAIELLAALASREPRLAAARQVLADVYARIGRPDLATRELDLALEARPDDAGARLARARLALAQGDRPRAIAELERLGPDQPEVQDALAGVLLSAPRPAPADLERARPLLEAVVQRSPGRAEPRARLGLLLAMRGEDGAARAAFEAARALDPALPAAHQDAALLLARGDPAARAALERAWSATADPRYGAALALVRGAAGAARDGLALLDRAGGPGPEDGVARVLLLALAGDAAAAAALAARPEVAAEVPAVVVAAAAGATRGEAPARAATLGALGALGWWHEVDARAARLAREPRPDPLEAWWALRALGPAGDAGVRVTLARALALLDPGSGPAGLALADAQARAGRREEALATLELVAARRSGDAAVALRLASALDAAGDRRRAVEHARRAVDAAPGSAAALNDLAWLLRGDPARRDEAIELARAALRLAPRAPEVQDTLGWLLAQAGRLPEARERLAQAVAARPLDPGLRYHLAWTLARSGEPARARNHAEVALLSGAPFAERTDAAALVRELAAAEPVDPTRTTPRRE